MITGNIISSKLLEIKELSIYIKQSGKIKPMMENISFNIHRGKFTALMGRSGIGKSLTIKAVLGLLREPLWKLKGDIIFYSGEIFCRDLQRNCPKLEEKEREYLLKNGEYDRGAVSELRGKKLFTIFQGPDSHLHPSLPVGWQIGEVIDPNQPRKKYDWAKAKLKEVGLNTDWLKRYPHQFAQGQRQRIMIAMALAEADLIIADEPTSALDSETKKGIIDLLKYLREKGKIKSMLLVTHDLETVEGLLYDDDTIIVMDDTKEEGVSIKGEFSKREIVESHFDNREFEGLLYDTSITSCHPLLEHEDYDWFRRERRGSNEKKIILKIEGLRQGYRQGIFGKTKAAVLKRIDLDVKDGEILGIVGESGCGKTTLVKAIARLLDNTDGKILFWPNYHWTPVNLIDLQPNGLKADSEDMKKLRKEIQVIFQDSASIFNPRMTIRELLSETLDIYGVVHSKEKLIKNSLSEMGICRDENGLEDTLSRYPNELSGGERQRLAIARVFLLQPKLVIADEPFAEQDKIIKEEILRMINIMNKDGTTFIIISHDLSLIDGVCDRVAIMEDGRINKVITQ